MSENTKPLKTETPCTDRSALSRRDFLKLTPPVLLGGIWGGSQVIADIEAASASPGINLSGRNLKGWELTLGDALYNRPGEPPVDMTDIEMIHERAYSELRANINRRIIMAHAIAYKRRINANSLNYLHSCSYLFRLPYIPMADEAAELNGETIEGGLFVWDGPGTRLDYGIAFQWIVNPWGDGSINLWEADGDAGHWVAGGSLPFDTNWHRVKMVVHAASGLARLAIDDKPYPVTLSKTTKDPSWGTEVAARLQAEIVSIYPEPAGLRAIHKAQFRNWRWQGKFIRS
ncbi:MAG: hypothetical protein HY865_11275 [Chloroflexi bacterium]|nr:hypothetical protein [Chloroflexota bacterium]